MYILKVMKGFVRTYFSYFIFPPPCWKCAPSCACFQHPHHLGAILIFRLQQFPDQFITSAKGLGWKFRAFHGHLHFRCRYLRWVVWLLSWTRLCNICSERSGIRGGTLGYPWLLLTTLEGSLLWAPLCPSLLGKSESIQNQQNLSLKVGTLRPGQSTYCLHFQDYQLQEWQHLLVTRFWFQVSTE